MHVRYDGQSRDAVAGVDLAIEAGRFVVLLGSYRRELWLWLMGERTWVQCCSGLIGRIERRLPAR